MNDLDFHIGQLVIANRILANEGVVDAYGHVSFRHPHHPERYLLACSRRGKQSLTPFSHYDAVNGFNTRTPVWRKSA